MNRHPQSAALPHSLVQAPARRPTALAAALALAAGLGVASAPARADNVQASASQNLSGLVQDVNGGASASAQWAPGASALATRRTLTVWTDGTTGSTATTAFGATAGAGSQYVLWDLAADRALTQAEADPIDLAFNFSLTGQVLVDPVSLSVASMGYSVALYSTGYEDTGANSSSVFGPTGYLHLGAMWIGDVNPSFSLMHRSDADGLLTTYLSSSAAFQSRAYGSLTLDSVTLAAGTLPTGGLGIRLSETGEIWVVSSPVPEPATWLQLLAGLGAAGWLRRRHVRAGAQARA